MTFDSSVLLQRIDALVPESEQRSRYLVGFSGGVDSSVLLHALTKADRQSVPIVAVHVNHGLQAVADEWETHCAGFAEHLGVAYLAVDARVSDDQGVGIEASARAARYAALSRVVKDGDVLISAHHEDDQAETLLLNLLRGSGLAGLAGIGARQSFGRGILLRPLLGVAGGEIIAYARRHKLSWIDDPSNEDTRFDRNFLRRQILPSLAGRWPAVANRLRRSADLAGEASELLNDLAAIDLAGLGDAGRIEIAALRKLSASRQSNVIRYAVRQCGLPPPPATRVYQLMHELVPARDDAQPIVCWPGAEARRYREHIFLLPAMDDLPPPESLRLSATGQLDLGPTAGRLRLESSDGPGLARSVARAGLELRYRHGGECIRPAGASHTRKLKKLLQEAGVVPWMRPRLPLLYSGDDLVAVADLWIAAEHATANGFRVCWDQRPPLQ